MSAQTEKPLRTVKTKSSSMFCESCGTQTIAKRTTIKIYKNGREVEREVCSECEITQETEYFKGLTTKIRNKR